MKTKEELRPTTPLDSTAKDGGEFLFLLFVKLSETKLSIYVTQKNF
ncbi:hypothetical protein [Enterococcus hirae]|nr:hypothetical protein [Enterococcus hirae]MCV3128192.1 hypothetical protein [Enterococcus hirae]MCV3130625.1 hypothetical protein [Enterococcus hirae]